MQHQPLHHQIGGLAYGHIARGLHGLLDVPFKKRGSALQWTIGKKQRERQDYVTNHMVAWGLVDIAGQLISLGLDRDQVGVACYYAADWTSQSMSVDPSELVSIAVGFGNSPDRPKHFLRGGAGHIAPHGIQAFGAWWARHSASSGGHLVEPEFLSGLPRGWSVLYNQLGGPVNGVTNPVGILMDTAFHGGLLVAFEGKTSA